VIVVSYFLHHSLMPYRRLFSSPRYCVAAFLIMMSGAPVLASQPEAARSTVERAIKVMGGDAVLTSVQTLQTHETHTAYRLTDSDHPEGPFLDSPTEATKYMELRHQRMVTQLDIRLPTGDEQVATVIYHFWMSRTTRQSAMRCSMNFTSHSCEIASKNPRISRSSTQFTFFVSSPV
jgi:hypothetical protein